MTKAEAIRTQVRDLDAQGQDTDEIAAALGIPATGLSISSTGRCP